MRDEATTVKITAKKTNAQTQTHIAGVENISLRDGRTNTCSYVSDVSGDLRVYMNTVVTKAHSVVTFFSLRHVTHDRVSSGRTTR